MRRLDSLGKLKQDPNVPEWWTSKPVPVGFCQGLALRFCVRVPADGNTYPPDVDQAVSRFLALTDEDRLRASGRVFARYQQAVQIIPETNLGIQDSADVWKHLTAEGISVDRYDEGDRAVYVRVVYRWDEEHGLQILLRGGATLTLVGEHEDGSFVE